MWVVIFITTVIPISMGLQVNEIQPFNWFFVIFAIRPQAFCALEKLINLPTRNHLLVDEWVRVTVRRNSTSKASRTAQLMDVKDSMLLSLQNTGFLTTIFYDEASKTENEEIIYCLPVQVKGKIRFRISGALSARAVNSCPK